MLYVTQQQKETLFAIESFHRKNGYPPSYQELCDVLDISSKNTISFRLRRLREMGLLFFYAGISRTVTLTGRGQEVLRDYERAGQPVPEDVLEKARQAGIEVRG